MGLFSVLQDEEVPGGSSEESQPTASSSIPTVLQLYTGEEPIQLEQTSTLSGYSTLTYQAIQIGTLEEEDAKNRHQNPDLGVWNCRTTNKLVDALLETLANKVPLYCLTVDLSQPNQVEPSLTKMQNALARHLIEYPPKQSDDKQKKQTATTSLFDLQATEFGKAKDDAKEGRSVNESFKNVLTTVMICAVLAPLEDGEDSDTYKTKQAQALVIYHLRKFAATLNCTLCFVAPPQERKEEGAVTSTASLQPTMTYDKLSEYWRDLALDKKIWETIVEPVSSIDEETKEADAPTPENVEVASALYGPGKHQEDLIDSVVLRSANYPGHWDASKDSLWVALPAPKENDENAGSSKDKVTGDAGWLGQLRDSIASAADAPAPSPEKKVQEGEKKKDGKDAEVSDFFASLLKKP